MAQVGCFVPAAGRPRLPVFDGLFVRLGASDDLFSGRSTLSAEMEEASVVLARATSRSLVLLDELGRGTSTADGCALARAVLTELVVRRRCLTVFVTHYKQLCDAADDEADTMANAHMGYVAHGASGDQVLFLYKLRQGRSEGSFGLNVARMAGLPETVVGYAETVIKALKDQHDAKN